MKNKNITKYAAAFAMLLAMSASASTVFAQSSTNDLAVEEAMTENRIEATGTITKNEKFGSAVFSLSPDAFAQAGFQLGDSVDIEFENGTTFSDVPFYNGYYVKTGAPIVVAYPGNDDVRIAYFNVRIWETENLKDGDTVTIRLHEAAKYASIQESLGQIYSFDRADYESDEQFCNFRTLSGGDLKENFLYRGASPVDASRGRASYTDTILKEYGISFILDLADSEENMNTYQTEDSFASFYTEGLYNDGNMALLDMGSGYQDEDYHTKLAEGLRQMVQHEGPVYIHCMEGKDRTGFVCMLLEALAGADYEELYTDYMTTYANYYGVTKEETPEKYDAIVELYFDSFVSYLHGTEDVEELKTADYTQDAKDYLSDAGMTEEEIEQLVVFLS